MHALGLEPLAMLPFVVAHRLRGRSVDVLQAAARRAARALRPRRAGAQRAGARCSSTRSSTSRAGKLISTEADAFWLPDTAGHRLPAPAHQDDDRASRTSTSSARRLGYFHNAGYYALEGEDFAQTVPPRRAARSRRSCRSSPSSCASIAWCTRPPDELRAMSRALLAQAPRAPAGGQSGRALRRSASRATCRGSPSEGLAFYHAWAFATVRQLGAAMELAAAPPRSGSATRRSRRRRRRSADQRDRQGLHPEGGARGQRASARSTPSPMFDEMAAAWQTRRCDTLGARLCSDRGASRG